MTNWSKWISLAKERYNSTYHSNLTLTPFEALYGYKSVLLPMGPHLDSVIPAAVQLLQERIRISTSIKEHLMKAQQRMENFAD